MAMPCKYPVIMEGYVSGADERPFTRVRFRRKCFELRRHATLTLNLRGGYCEDSRSLNGKEGFTSIDRLGTSRAPVSPGLIVGSDGWCARAITCFTAR